MICFLTFEAFPLILKFHHLKLHHLCRTSCANTAPVRLSCITNMAYHMWGVDTGEDTLGGRVIIIMEPRHRQYYGEWRRSENGEPHVRLKIGWVVIPAPLLLTGWAAPSIPWNILVLLLFFGNHTKGAAPVQICWLVACTRLVAIVAVLFQLFLNRQLEHEVLLLLKHAQEYHMPQYQDL